MLGITPSLYVDTIIAYNITPVICSLDVAETYAKAAAKRGALVSGLVAIDTGMGRIGYRPDEEHAIPEIKAMSQLEGFKIRGLITHFSDADAADKEYSRMQEKQYHDFCKALEAEGIEIPIRTLANSAAIMDLPETYCDAVRAGIIMYGLYPSDDVDHSQLDLTPVMSVKASIVHLKEVPPGTSISYGRKFTTDRVSKIATIALGYADGYSRLNSGKISVLVGGIKCPVVGNICMDQCMVDVSAVPDVKLGDEVVILGKQGDQEISADDLAAINGTINYEITCCFDLRIPKVYINYPEGMCK